MLTDESPDVGMYVIRYLTGRSHVCLLRHPRTFLLMQSQNSPDGSKYVIFYVRGLNIHETQIVHRRFKIILSYNAPDVQNKTRDCQSYAIRYHRRSHVLHQVNNRTVTVGVLMYANAYNMYFTNHAAIRPDT